MRSLKLALLAAAALLTAHMIAPPAPAQADPVADFYRGKSMRIIVRTTAGGDYHQYSYLLSRFMGRFIPGNPTIQVVNMPGGGGIVAANFMANVAPRDGTVIGIVGQGIPLDQALGNSSQLKADMRQFNWIANVVYSNQLLAVWHTSPVKTIEDAKRKEILIGTTGSGSPSVQYPSFYNAVLGTKFKLVSGYISGTEIDLAMERGEVHGRGTNPYSGYMASRPTWIPEGKLVPIIQAGMSKEPKLPDVPLILDQKVPPQDKPLLEVMARASALGRPLATTPGVPPERLAALRKAFFAMIEDPDFKATAAREHMEIRTMTGDELDKLVKEILDAPQDVKDRVKAAMQPKDALINKAK